MVSPSVHLGFGKNCRVKTPSAKSALVEAMEEPSRTGSTSEGGAVTLDLKAVEVRVGTLCPAMNPVGLITPANAFVPAAPVAEMIIKWRIELESDFNRTFL